ncbi:hypothetical protein MOD24_14825 [Bacillus haynesii]|uniref:hypothetical protein n=1 Tax=Bacillus haynesii TaxID=1925021 RepID=UPI002282EFC8|nr:hypothetical protein [Bacillus haynesii]MCY8577121.1 hypothetical protein [Bacillus haynesii]MEC1657182.1 hypothetical protein [Bacillus haynesii]
MDIISLGKANKALKEMQELDQNVIGKKAESRFNSIDARLDWLEQQAAKMKAKSSWEVDLSKGVFDDTTLVDDRLQLKPVNDESYVSEGVWESEVVDLGEDWLKTTEIQVK